MTSEALSNNSSSSKQQPVVKIPPISTSSRMGAIAAVVFTALLTGSLISSTANLGDESASRIISYLQMTSLFAIFFSLLGSKNAPQAAPTQKQAKSSYLQAYPQNIASRIEKREKLIHDSYKEGFRNLVTLLVSLDMSLEEAESLLHFIAALEPEKRKEIYDLLRGPFSSATTQENRYAVLQTMLLNQIPLNKAKPCLEAICQLIRPKTPEALKTQTGCPFQHIWTQPTFSNDPLAVQEALKLHRFEENVFNSPISDRSNQEVFQQETSVIASSPSDTPRYRKIFFDLILKKKRERPLQYIIQDHFDPLFETSSYDAEDPIDHLFEMTYYDSQDPFNLIASLNDCLQKIAGCILDEISIDWRSFPPALNSEKLSESQLYQDLLNAGYTHGEIVTNLSLLAGVIEQNGKSFLSTLLVHLHKHKFEAQELLAKVRQDVQKQIESSKSIWDAIRDMKEIDMIILESLRMSNTLPSIERTLSEPSKTIEISLNTLAMRSDLVGEKPEEFRPTRMVEGPNKQISHYWPSSVSWMPFGHGKHLCPAWGLYQMMSRYMVAKIALSDSNQ